MKRFTVLTIIITIFLISGCDNETKFEMSDDKSKTQVVNLQASYPYDVSNMEVVAESFSHIFIGEITKVRETLPYEGQSFGSHIPYTIYEVKILENIKGETTSKHTLVYYGGLDDDSDTMYLCGQSSLPTIGEVYLFTVDWIDNNLDEREIGYDFRVGWHPSEMFIISEYDKSKKIIDQDEDIFIVLNRYSVAVEEYESKEKEK